MDSHECSSRLTDDAKSMLSTVSGSKKSTISSVEEEAPANRPKDRRTRVSETPEHDSESSPKSILKNVSLLLNKPPPQQTQWYVPGMELYRKRKSKSSASSMLVTATDSAELNASGTVMESHSKKRKKGKPRKSAATENKTGSKSEAKHQERGRASKYMAPPLSPDEAPPTHATTALVSSESEVEVIDQNQEPTEVAESSKSKKGHPRKSMLKLKKPSINLVSSESEFEGEMVHNKVEESSKRKRGRQHKASMLTHDATLTSRVEVEVPEERQADGLQETITVEYPKKKRGRRHKPMQEATSSESELDDWLETVQEDRDGGESRKSGLASQEKKKSVQANESKSEMIVEGLQNKTLEGKRGRGRPRKTKGAERSASSGSEMEGEKTTQNSQVEISRRGEMEQSKRGRGRPRKVKPAEPVSSESDVEEKERHSKSETESENERQDSLEIVSGLVSAGDSEGEQSAESAHLEHELPVKKSEAKRGKGRSRKSAAPPASESGESEMDEHAKHRGIHPLSADGLVIGDGRVYQKKKKKSKNTLTMQEEALENERQPVVEIRDEPQFSHGYDNFDNGDDDYDSPLSPTGMYDDDDDSMGSRVTSNDVPPATTPGSAGSRGGEQAADLSGAQSIDVSVLPRLIKRKRARGNRVIVAPRSKKQKQIQMLDGTVQDPTLATPQGGGRVVVDDTYSMSTSGEEGEESDHFDGAEIIQSGGGRRYRRLRVEPKKSHTPGVRRSKRTRVAPVRHWENEQLEYDLNTSGKIIIFPVRVLGIQFSSDLPHDWITLSLSDFLNIYMYTTVDQGVKSRNNKNCLKIYYYYCHNVHVGAILKGVLVPVEQERQGPSRQKRPNTAMIPERQLGPQEDDAFSPYRVTDDMGNTSEMGELNYYAVKCTVQPEICSINLAKWENIYPSKVFGYIAH